MAEDGAKIENPNLSRRKAIKKSSAVAGGVALGGLSAREMQIIEHGLNTKVGIFFPLYEQHDKGIQAKDIPPNLDFFFREMVMDETSMGLPPASLLKATSFRDSTELIKPEAFEILAQDGVKIAFGDVPPRTIDLLDENWMAAYWADEIKTRSVRTAAGVVSFSAGEILKEFAEIDEKYGPKTVGTISRRMLGKTIMAAGVGLAVPPAADLVLTLGTLFFALDLGQKNAVMRIRNRLVGMISHALPEDDITFFRNAVMADKLLTLAELPTKKNNKPCIAFNVGANHAGIEDFLIAGHDFTRWIITRLPNWYIQPSIDRSGGLENFCSLRVLTIPKNMKKSELEDERSANQRIQEERIMDKGLYEDLTTRFQTP